MDAWTRGMNDLIADNAEAAKFTIKAIRHMRTLKPVSMVVGRPGMKETIATEDDGRTLVLPLPADMPKLYACENETGGVTVMLADEY